MYANVIKGDGERTCFAILLPWYPRQAIDRIL